MDIFRAFSDYSLNRHGIYCHRMPSVRAPYGGTTLFTIAGIQSYAHLLDNTQHKHAFTATTSQACLRFNDYDTLDDATHSLYFNMLGLFAFRSPKFENVSTVIQFWLAFLKELKLWPDYATIHMERPEWIATYKAFGIPVHYDGGCEWTDGTIKGYCTEMYIDGIEIGNIVNPAENCFDCGFGEERLDQIVNKTLPKTKLQKLIDAADAMIRSGVYPGPLKDRYCLRKVLREIYRMGGAMDNNFFREEIKRQQTMLENYERLKDKNTDKTPEWWLQTHGVIINEVCSDSAKEQKSWTDVPMT